MIHLRCTCGTLLLSIVFAAAARADVKMPAIFADHMVLQRDRAVPIWGWASPGESVTVTAGSQTATAAAGPDGKWSLKLNSLSLSPQPISLTIAGKNTISINDVLVGDVWICAGQSNMGFPLSGIDDAAAVAKSAKDDQLRLFTVTPTLSFEVQDDCQGHWTLCDADTVRNFSAVGYFFGRGLRSDLKIPIGLVFTSLGGTSCQSWTSRDGLEKFAVGRALLASFDRDQAKLRAATDTYNNVTVPQWRKADLAWRRDVNPGYQAQLKQWNDAVVAARAAGQSPPPRPEPSVPRPSLAAAPNRHTPTLLYNAMAAPLIPFAMKGIAWYQGEANADNARQFRDEFPALIQDWRAKWGEGDVPFVFVQLANYRPPSPNVPDAGKWAATREAQLLALSQPNTAMVVTTDVGDPDNVHYHNKLPVGERLALCARHLAYGENIVFSGPLYDRMDIASGGIRITFSQTGAGLMVGTPPHGPFASPAPAQTPLKDFQIAGADRHFVPADAKIDGDAVIVSSPQVADPVAVRYGWSDNPQGNLYNRDGLPASPFRTDGWDK
jgi:sialate O-acetylesterase